jgi:hypothetical protein
LEASGHNGQKVAEQIPGEADKIVGSTDQAAGGLKGFTTAGAVHDCTAAWNALLKKLSGDMDGYGAKMITMAQNYRNGEQDVTNNLYSISVVGGGGGGPLAPPVGGAGDPFGTVLTPVGASAAHRRGQEG